MKTAPNPRPKNVGGIDDIIKGPSGSVLDNVKNGELALDNTQQKGNFGEMNMDDVAVNKKSLDKISEKTVTSLDQKIEKGIDGVYDDPTGGAPKYVIGETKYNTALLNTLADGTKQMSKKWVQDRLKDAVGKEKALEIIKELATNPDNVQFLVVRTLNESGDYVKQILDMAGNIIK